ncbi:uncharacterized protein LOC136088812 isoform X4 [Hydra vulgaris]|uniref:Uncharacterized protein LOC136088812 isoform X4 n=1 Tax=Hydra vulgaris TaxID=6087 RepID=A0ABM4D5Y1_HYDVU
MKCQVLTGFPMKYEYCPVTSVVTLKSARAKERLAEENSDLSSAEDGSRIIYAPSRFNSQEYCQPLSKISKITSNSHTTSYLNNPLITHTPALVSHPSLNQTSASFSNDDHGIFDTQEFLRPLAKVRKFSSNCQTTSSNNYPSFPDNSALVTDF